MKSYVEAARFVAEMYWIKLVFLRFINVWFLLVFQDPVTFNYITITVMVVTITWNSVMTPIFSSQKIFKASIFEVEQIVSMEYLFYDIIIAQSYKMKDCGYNVQSSFGFLSIV